MSINTENPDKQHTLKVFEGELNHLHQLLLDMGGLIGFQLDQTMLALDDGDMPRAEHVISRDREIKQLEINIDGEVLKILASQCPVAGDLRTVISTSKIADELEKIGDEITDFAKLVTVLFDSKTSDPNPKLLADVVKIGHLVQMMIVDVLILLKNRQATLAYSLLQYDLDCEAEIQEGIKNQLNLVMNDARLTSRALDIMRIMNSLQLCGEYCRNIAEHMIFMIEGIDVRHRHAIENNGKSKV